jgi:hypothetical protein
MQRDLKLARSKLKSAKLLPESNFQERKLKDDIVRHWTFERDKLKLQIKDDIRILEYLSKEFSKKQLDQ